MKLVVTEKNDAAQKIADLLGVKKPKADKVYSTPVYRFDVDGEELSLIHIFPALARHPGRVRHHGGHLRARARHRAGAWHRVRRAVGVAHSAFALGDPRVRGGLSLIHICNLLNGGAFGIEGGVLATVAALLALAYALFRYRASRYRFFEEAGKEG